MTSNRVTLAQLDEMPIEEAARLPVEQLVMLLEEAAEMKAAAKAADDRLHSILTLRYADSAAEARKVAGKDTGTVNLRDGDFTIRADLPKRVVWDQAKLREAVEAIRGWGEDPADYVAVEMKVAETKYNAWPSSIKGLFEPARTVGVGKPTFTIEPAKRRAA